MPILIECPTCSRRVKVPLEASGRVVECPGCEGHMSVPEIDEADDIPRAQPAKKRPTLRRDDDDDDRPRRRPLRDDDDDDLPRRPLRKSAGLSQEQKLYIGIGGGVAALVLLGVALWGFGAFKKSTVGGVTTASGRTAPAGWTAVNDRDFSAFMPGTPRQTSGAVGGYTENGVPVETAGVNPAGVDRQSNYHCRFGSAGTEVDYRIMVRAYDSQTVGITEDFLAQEVQKIDRAAHFNHLRRGGQADGLIISPITMGGKSGCEFRYDQPNPNKLKPGEKDPFDTPFFNGDDPGKAKRERAERVASWENSLNRAIYRVIPDGKRVFIFSINLRGKPIDADMAKTFFDSFEPK